MGNSSIKYEFPSYYGNRIPNNIYENYDLCLYLEIVVHSQTENTISNVQDDTFIYIYYT